MKRFLLCATTGLLTCLMCSCGSLTHQVGGPTLTKENLEFARHMDRDPDWIEMRKTFDGVTHYTDKWTANAMPTFPILYWVALGSFENDKYFEVQKFTMLFPAFYLIRDKLYNSEGARISSGFELNLACVVCFETIDSYEANGWKLGFAWLPGMGPFFGFGRHYFQLAWIPFSELL